MSLALNPAVLDALARAVLVVLLARIAEAAIL